MPDSFHRASIFVSLWMDPRYQPAEMTEMIGHARQLSSGIHLRFLVDGSPLPTGGDDHWYAFG